MEVKVVTVKAGRMSLCGLGFRCDFLLSVLLYVLLYVLLNLLLDVLLLCWLNLLDLLDLAFDDDLGLPVNVLLLVEPNSSPPVLEELDVALHFRPHRYP